LEQAPSDDSEYGLPRRLHICVWRWLLALKSGIGFGNELAADE